MATHLDLEEQEQLDQLKAFWKQYGNLITWTLILVLAGYSAFNAWQWWQRDQAANAAALYDALDRAAGTGDAAAASKVFADMKDRYPRTTYAQQGGLLAAKVAFDKGNLDTARDALVWVRDQAGDSAYGSVARLRLAGVLLDQKKYDEALAELAKAEGAAFEALVADRRGDVLQAQGKTDAAKAAYLDARKAIGTTVEYRRLVDAKLTALGVPAEGTL